MSAATDAIGWYVLSALCTNWKCLPEIATAPLGPRNDKSGAFTIVTATGTSRSCGAGRGQPGPYKARAFARRSVQIGSAFPRLPRPRWGLAMTNLLTLRHRIRAAKPTACKALTTRKGHAASVKRQSRQRLRSERRYRRNWSVHFIDALYELQVPSRDCTPRALPRASRSGRHVGRWPPRNDKSGAPVPF